MTRFYLKSTLNINNSLETSWVDRLKDLDSPKIDSILEELDKPTRFHKVVSFNSKGWSVLRNSQSRSSTVKQPPKSILPFINLSYSNDTKKSKLRIKIEKIINVIKKALPFDCFHST